MDKMREEFEGWVRRRGGDVMKRDRDYISSMTREWWQAWQASRQALVVELPKVVKLDFGDEFSNGVEVGKEIMIDDVADILKESGIKCT